jgi:hypothetical protein
MDEIQNDVCEESIHEVGSSEIRERVRHSAPCPYSPWVLIDEFFNDFSESGRWLDRELHLALVLADFLTRRLLLNRL